MRLFQPKSWSSIESTNVIDSVKYLVLMKLSEIESTKVKASLKNRDVVRFIESTNVIDSVKYFVLMKLSDRDWETQDI